MEYQYDLIIIGGGPGGTEAAEEAAGLGLKTALIERDHLGGTCLNRGCIPTKTILHAADIYREAKAGAELGLVHQDQLAIDAAALQNYKEKTLATLRDGLAYTMKHCGVEVINGEAAIISAHQVRVGQQFLAAKNILIASGSVPGRLPIPGADLPGVVTSDELLSLTHIPSSLVIIGGGVIGMEFSAVYSSLGCRVTVIESLKRILFNFDKEISRSLAMVMDKRGVDIHTGALVSSIEPAADAPDGTAGGKLLRCCFEEKGETRAAEGELVLLATGRKPYTGGLFCAESDEQVKAMTMEKGCITVNDAYETSVPGIYAIGDVTGGIQLAHVASAEGRNAVAHMAGATPPVHMDEIPSCVYTDPEIASVGLTADAAKAAGKKVLSKKYLMSSNGKSVLTGQERGFIKIIADPETEKVLGAQLMCARATDMISQFSQAIAAGLCLNDMARIIYPHPTFCEGIGKAAGK